MTQETKMLIENPEFQEAVLAMREKWAVELREAEESEKDWDFFINEKEYREALNAILKRFSLHEEWEELVDGYILWGDDFVMRDPNAPQVIKKISDDVTDSSDEPIEFLIKVSPFTTKDEVLRAWRDAKKQMQETVPKVKKFKLWLKFKRDTMIYKLAIDGKSIEEICNTIRQKYGEDLDYGHIKKIVSNYHRRMKIKGKPPTLRTEGRKRGLLWTV